MSTLSLTTDTVDVFGPMVSRGDVTNAILAQLQDPWTGLLFYLAERERRAGLAPRRIPAPPSPASYRGGLDFETFGSDEFPVVIVVVQRDGNPERFDSGRYDQWFECQVGAIVQHETEAEAIALADSYGIALALCLGQNPALADLAVAARLTDYPVTEFPNIDRRNIVRSTVTYRVDIDPVLDEHYGPPQGKGPPYPDPYARAPTIPIVTEVDMSFTTTSLDGMQEQTERVKLAPRDD